MTGGQSNGDGSLFRVPVLDLDVPKEAPILLFGGSFDPPHVGHVGASVAARDELFGEAGWLVVVPAGRSPHKGSGPVASGDERAAMLRLAFAGVERVFVWDDELRRREVSDEPSYTVETVLRLRSVRPDGSVVRLLIGADQAVSFDRWHRAAEIEAMSPPAVMPRGAYRAWADLEAAGLEESRWRSRLLTGRLIDASSTGVRGGDGDVLSPAVRAFVEERGLYGGPSGD